MRGKYKSTEDVEVRLIRYSRAIIDLVYFRVPMVAERRIDEYRNTKSIRGFVALRQTFGNWNPFIGFHLLTMLLRSVVCKLKIS